MISVKIERNKAEAPNIDASRYSNNDRATGCSGIPQRRAGRSHRRQKCGCYNSKWFTEPNWIFMMNRANRMIQESAMR
jgi:hypothetical protein